MTIEQVIFQFNFAIEDRWKSEINNSMSAGKIRKYLLENHKPLSPLDIILTVCEHFEVSLDDIVCGRPRPILSRECYARAIMARLLMEYSSFCLDEKSMAKIIGLSSPMSLNRYANLAYKEILAESDHDLTGWNMMIIPKKFTKIKVE